MFSCAHSRLKPSYEKLILYYGPNIMGRHKWQSKKLTTVHSHQINISTCLKN
jgi:hypothetical protein